MTTVNVEMNALSVVIALKIVVECGICRSCQMDLRELSFEKDTLSEEDLKRILTSCKCPDHVHPAQKSDNTANKGTGKGTGKVNKGQKGKGSGRKPAPKSITADSSKGEPTSPPYVPEPVQAGEETKEEGEAVSSKKKHRKIFAAGQVEGKGPIRVKTAKRPSGLVLDKYCLTYVKKSGDLCGSYEGPIKGTTILANSLAAHKEPTDNGNGVFTFEIYYDSEGFAVYYCDLLSEYAYIIETKLPVKGVRTNDDGMILHGMKGDNLFAIKVTDSESGAVSALNPHKDGRLLDSTGEEYVHNGEPCRWVSK